MVWSKPWKPADKAARALARLACGLATGTGREPGAGSREEAIEPTVITQAQRGASRHLNPSPSAPFRHADLIARATKLREKLSVRSPTNTLRASRARVHMGGVDSMD